MGAKRREGVTRVWQWGVEGEERRPGDGDGVLRGKWGGHGNDGMVMDVKMNISR